MVGFQLIRCFNAHACGLVLGGLVVLVTGCVWEVGSEGPVNEETFATTRCEPLSWKKLEDNVVTYENASLITKKLLTSLASTSTLPKADDVEQSIRDVGTALSVVKTNIQNLKEAGRWGPLIAELARFALLPDTPLDSDGKRKRQLIQKLLRYQTQFGSAFNTKLPFSIGALDEFILQGEWKNRYSTQSTLVEEPRIYQWLGLGGHHVETFLPLLFRSSGADIKIVSVDVQTGALFVEVQVRDTSGWQAVSGKVPRVLFGPAARLGSIERAIGTELGAISRRINQNIGQGIVPNADPALVLNHNCSDSECEGNTVLNCVDPLDNTFNQRIYVAFTHTPSGEEPFEIRQVKSYWPDSQSFQQLETPLLLQPKSVGWK